MRELCSSVLLQFLLDYPLGTRRLQQHLHLLLANLSFEHAAGRQAAASTLRALSFKLPTPLLDTWAPVFFLPLVAQLVNEDDNGCQRELSAAVQALFQANSFHVCTEDHKFVCENCLLSCQLHQTEKKVFGPSQSRTTYGPPPPFLVDGNKHLSR